MEANTSMYLRLEMSVKLRLILLSCINQNRLFLYGLYGRLCFVALDRNELPCLIRSVSNELHLLLALLSFLPIFMVSFCASSDSKTNLALHSIQELYKKSYHQFLQYHIA